jgi:Tfp pilus assembly protein PilF
MKPEHFSRSAVLLLCIAWATFVSSFPAAGQRAAAADEIRIVEAQGLVELSTDGGVRWVKTQKDQMVKTGDWLRTGENSGLRLLLSDQSTAVFNELTEIEVLPPHQPQAQAGWRLIRGLFAFFHRDKPGRIRVVTRGAAAGVDGTTWAMQVDFVDNVERTTLFVIDGVVRFGNELNELVVTNSQGAVVVLGQAPVYTAGFIVNNVLQWAFYYPAVLNLDELPLAPAEEQALAESMKNYRAGELLAALASYPAGRQPATDAERVYYAALLLSVGQAAKAETILATVAADASPRLTRLSAALRHLIAAVKLDQSTNPPIDQSTLSTEFLAASYYEQSLGRGDESLLKALELARQSVAVAPNFAFGWARVAELEFSFGRTGKALEALERSLDLAPRNPQALALKGFLLAAQNKTRDALKYFDDAIAIDAALGNAWLGRGLVRIRRGDLKGGRQDLLIAAAAEPQRSVLRSYLGKAYAEEDRGLFGLGALTGRGVPTESRLALHELELAKGLDPNDPTAWLYSALLKEEQNRANEAIADLERSKELNRNRLIYRSRLLLDQDEATRSANLARIYADTGMEEVAVREAGRAVTVDYANYSPHVFLANSYEVERRANLSNLRFETASLSEYLLANLLGPANGRLLAQPITQLEYGSLFERNRLGLIANTEYFSRGAWHHSGAQYGTYDGSSYSLEAEYRAEPGERINQDLEIRQLEAKFKHDLTPSDSMYFHVLDYRAEGGDNRQLFDESEVARTFRFEQEQTPTILAGFHHQWSPQHHTLLLAGRFDETLDTLEPDSEVLAADRGSGQVIGFALTDASHTYRKQVELYSAELQQIAVAGRQSFVFGARGQWSKQKVADRVEDPFGEFFFLLGLEEPVSVQDEEVTTSSGALYAYDYLQLHDTLQLIGGLNYTVQSIPVNAASAPISSERDHQDRLTPKAAIVWSPVPWSSIRAAYSQSLGGAGFGQSYRLEPTHLAGLLQTFRDPVPPSLVGELDGADIETIEGLWEGRLHHTYMSVGAQQLVADADRQRGMFFQDDPFYVERPLPGLVREQVRFREQAAEFAIHQLINTEWSFGARYRLGYARLKRSFPDYPDLGVNIDDRTDWRGWLHTVALSGLYRHASGVFARADGVFWAQDREREGLDIASDDFWQANFIAGYRFPKQRAELAVGVLNILDCDYRLDPINQYADQPRERTFYARLLINF